jgi:hypothetical protein
MKNFPLVRAKWPEHRERLKAVIDEIGVKANDPELYANIDKACSNEWAFLFLASDGFIVLQPRYQRQIIYIDITAAHFTDGNAIPKHLPFLVMLAKKGNAQFIRFYTVRKGAEKVAPKYGWEKLGYHRNLAVWRYKL